MRTECHWLDLGEAATVGVWLWNSEMNTEGWEKTLSAFGTFAKHTVSAPKYDNENFVCEQNVTGRIWGRLGGGGFGRERSYHPRMGKVRGEGMGCGNIATGAKP